jgi:hypothetical protein
MEEHETSHGQDGQEINGDQHEPLLYEERSLHSAAMQFLSAADQGAGWTAGAAAVTGVTAGVWQVGKKVLGKGDKQE